VASGLNTAWVAPKKPKNGIVDLNVDLEAMDDQVTLLTRPDFLPSLVVFDCGAATAQLSKAS
jgi:hypothetical protein